MHTHPERQETQKGSIETISAKQCLIVDNNPDHQELVSLVMEQLSVRACYTEYRPSIMQQIEELAPDLLVLDLVPGQEETLNTLRAVQEHELTRQIPVLCLSTDSSLLNEAQEIFSFPAGAWFLQKPFDIEEMESAVQSLLERQMQV
jgi:DNA-binding response OmpR family regulator